MNTLMIILSSVGLLFSSGYHSINNSARLLNIYTQSNIGATLERNGCELTTKKLKGQQIEVTVNHCLSISNKDAIHHIIENVSNKPAHEKQVSFIKPADSKNSIILKREHNVWP